MGKWSNRVLITFPWIGVILALFLLLLTTVKLIPASIREREFQKQRIAFLEEQIAETEHSIEIKRRFLNKLNTNPAFLERVAREKLKYVRPGETVIQIEEPKKEVSE